MFDLKGNLRKFLFHESTSGCALMKFIVNSKANNEKLKGMIPKMPYVFNEWSPGIRYFIHINWNNHLIPVCYLLATEFKVSPDVFLEIVFQNMIDILNLVREKYTSEDCIKQYVDEFEAAITAETTPIKQPFGKIYLQSQGSKWAELGNDDDSILNLKSPYTIVANPFYKFVKR